MSLSTYERGEISMTNEQVKALLLKLIESDTDVRDALVGLLRQSYSASRLAKAIEEHRPK